MCLKVVRFSEVVGLFEWGNSEEPQQIELDKFQSRKANT